MDAVSSPDRPRVVGIVNLSRDSFSDGGEFSDVSRAVERVEELLDAGAHWVELGAASSHPDAAEIPAADELAHLVAVLDQLEHRRDRIGVDTWKPAVQRHCLERNVAFINDIAGFDDANLYPELARSECALVIMHSIQRGKATRAPDSGESMPVAISRFLEARADALIAAGVRRDRIIVDPGMGFFLADTPEPSFEVLAAIDELRGALELPVLVSVSRKSFLGAVTGRGVTERGAATLAAELYAVGAGVDYIRTHDVAALKDGLVVLRLLAAANLRRGRSGADV